MANGTGRPGPVLAALQGGSSTITASALLSTILAGLMTKRVFALAASGDMTSLKAGANTQTSSLSRTPAAKSGTGKAISAQNAQLGGFWTPTQEPACKSTTSAEPTLLQAAASHATEDTI